MSVGRDASPETEQKIQEARTTGNTPAFVQRLPVANFRDLLEARTAQGAAQCLTFFNAEGERSEWSHAQFAVAVAARAKTLAEQLGLARGDRLALLMHNNPNVPISAFAAWSLGITLVPINMGEDEDRIAFVLENSDAKAALTLQAYQERVASLSARLPKIETWLAADTLDEPACSMQDLDSFEAPDGEDDALIVYTSGTTGAPKGVILTQLNLLTDAWAIAQWQAIDEETRMMCVLPTHHVNGLVVTLITPYLAGGSTVLNRQFRTVEFWKRIAEEEVHVVSVVPTLLAFLLEEPDAARELDLPLRHITCGAGPLTVDLARNFEDCFQVCVLHGYGLSETTCYSCFLPIDLSADEHAHWMRDFGFPSIGCPIEANEMQIQDSEGNPLGPGERGEIVIGGVNVMRAYYRRPEANEETFAHGWFRSGDEGFFERDEQGRCFFFITGRMKELIIRGGINMSPLEIDEVLNQIPGVAGGLAVGFENDWYGEEVGAFVKLEDGASQTAEAILDACREKLSFAKSPKIVVFGEEIPVTATGKYQRIRLRPLFEEYKSVQFKAPR